MIPDIIYITGNMPVFDLIPYRNELDIELRINYIAELERSIYNYVVKDIENFAIIDLDIADNIWYPYIEKVKENYINECKRYNVDRSYYKISWIKIPDSVIFISKELGVKLCTMV